jgi:hypothetical protein
LEGALSLFVSFRPIRRFSLTFKAEDRVPDAIGDNLDFVSGLSTARHYLV